MEAISAAALPGSGLEALKKHLADHCDVLLDLAELPTTKPAIASAARKALSSLGVMAAAPVKAEEPAPALLLSVPAPAAAPAPSAVALPADLFGGLSLSSAPIQPAQGPTFSFVPAVPVVFSPATTPPAAPFHSAAPTGLSIPAQTSKAASAINSDPFDFLSAEFSR